MRNQIQTVITAAGYSERQFLDSGFGVPKGLVLVNGQSVISRAIESYSVDDQQLSVALNEEECERWAIDQHVSSLYPTARISRVTSSAQGAVASALLASSAVDPDRPLVIAAGDSELSTDIWPIIADFLDAEVAGGTVVFRASGPRWSYVGVDGRGQVTEVSEKYQIGDLATVGLFFFRTARLFLDASGWTLFNNAHVGGNFYVSTTLNYLISEGLDIRYREIDPQHYKPWSRPQDFKDSPS